MKKIITLLLIASVFSAKSQDSKYLDDYNEVSKIEATWIEPEVVFPKGKDTIELSESDLASIEADKAFLKDLPKSYENIPEDDLKGLASKFQSQIQRLISEKEELLKKGSKPELIESKDNAINGLNKEKNIVDLTIDKDHLKIETKDLKKEKKKLKGFLTASGIGILLLMLFIIVLLQRKTIKHQDGEIEKQIDDINKKNNYLEHAARIIRHDMHSGINTYMPRGISSLEKRISEEKLRELKIDGSVKMIKEGLAHTQKVYKSVYEFTNLVKPNSVFEKEECEIKKILDSYIENTSYRNSVEIFDLGIAKINPYLFSTAIDNLIRNGLKFNDSQNKRVKIFREKDYLIVEDNGLGLSSSEFEKIRKNKNKQGLGLNICIAIIDEHGFNMQCEKIPSGGTQIKIKIT